MQRYDTFDVADINDLRRRLGYDPDTGVFVWIGGRCNGRRAGALNRVTGYRSIKCSGKRIYEHRLAWFYVHETWPTKEIDHKNRDKSDNRLVNLREATRVQNLANSKGKTGSIQKGVTADPDRKGKWRARIRFDGRRYHLGSFDQRDDAQATYDYVAKIVHGEYARAN